MDGWMNGWMDGYIDYLGNGWFIIKYYGLLFFVDIAVF